MFHVIILERNKAAIKGFSRLRQGSGDIRHYRREKAKGGDFEGRKIMVANLGGVCYIYGAYQMFLHRASRQAGAGTIIRTLSPRGQASDIIARQSCLWDA